MDDMKAEIMKTRDNIMELSRETSHCELIHRNQCSSQVIPA